MRIFGKNMYISVKEQVVLSKQQRSFGELYTIFYIFKLNHAVSILKITTFKSRFVHVEEEIWTNCILAFAEALSGYNLTYSASMLYLIFAGTTSER